jgi:hypothetical protein
MGYYHQVKIVQKLPFRHYSNNPDMIFSKDVKEANIGLFNTMQGMEGFW